MAFRGSVGRRWPRPASATSGEDPFGDAGGAESLVQDDLFGALIDHASDGEDDALAVVTSPWCEESAAAKPTSESVPHPTKAAADLPSEDERARFGLERAPECGLEARPYQEEAIAAWTQARGRGVVVLPTGAGKTVVAMLIAARLGLRTLVVVPTIELLNQWREQLADRLGYPLDHVGIVGGGKRTIRDLTVITYDSARLPSRRLDAFGLLIVDEVHHLPASAYRGIAAKVNAPYRLGLTATPERSDHGHLALDTLIGLTVYRRSPAELARDQYIASYDERRIHVNLSDDERARYDQFMSEYRLYMATHRGSLGSPATAFTELIRRAGSDPAARSALRAHHQARMIALNADAKIAKLADLLADHRDDKVIVFSEYTTMVDLLSERLLLPAITYRTALPERRDILERFRNGEYHKLVTGRVLNEGVDVPDANVAIVVSGSSATREYIQRLGRVLRPKATTAQLYEIITRRTTEGRSARRRRAAA